MGRMGTKEEQYVKFGGCGLGVNLVRQLLEPDRRRPLPGHFGYDVGCLGPFRARWMPSPPLGRLRHSAAGWDAS